MIKPGALVMAVLMAAVTTGTYYGLDLLPPSALPGPLGRTPPPPPPKVGANEGVVVAAVSLDSATDAAAAPAPTQEAAADQDVTEEPPPPAQPAPQAAAPPPAAAPAPKAEPQAAQPAPAPATEAAAPPPAPKPKARPAPKPAMTTAAVDEPSAPIKAKPPEADVIKPWWPDPEKMPANQLKLQYAGQVQGQQAIALLFSAPLNIDSVKLHAIIRTLGGDNVAGQWELGKNPRLAVFHGVKPGRYTVILAPEIADQKGFMLGTTLQGPVYITE